jgi:hypothetical protein
VAYFSNLVLIKLNRQMNIIYGESQFELLYCSDLQFKKNTRFVALLVLCQIKNLQSEKKLLTNTVLNKVLDDANILPGKKCIH